MHRRSRGSGRVAGTEVMAVFPATADWQSRLRALARVNGFVFRRDAGLLEVELATPVPDAPALPTAPVAPAIAAATVQPERIASAVLRLVNARAADLAAALERPLGSGGVSSGVDAATNAIVFGGPVSAVDDALELARKLDVPRRRFLLEAHIVEISRSTSSEMGVQWTLESNDLGAIVDFPAADAAGEGAGILVATSGTHSLRARLSALESSGRVRVVSRPRIVVLEGKAASIEAVRILRVRLPDRGTVVAEADSNASLDSGRAFDEIPVGVTLNVEPSLQGDGNVVLRITAKSSTLGPPQPPDGIPEELSRRVEAEVAVADGDTAVLGGLLREGRSRSGSGVPVLRSIPVFGALFGEKQRSRDVEELIVLVTPHLVD
jgi:general secretion pathway protein D